MLGVLAVYFAGAFALGRPAALAGAGLLAVHVAQVWFARYFCAEMIVQPLVFAGVLAHARAQADGDRFFAPVAALLLGLTLFAHILGVLIVGAACLAALVGRADGQPVLASFGAPLAAVTALAGAYYLTVLAPYTPLWFVATLGPLHITAAAARRIRRRRCLRCARPRGNGGDRPGLAAARARRGPVAARRLRGARP